MKNDVHPSVASFGGKRVLCFLFTLAFFSPSYFFWGGGKNDAKGSARPVHVVLFVLFSSDVSRANVVDEYVNSESLSLHFRSFWFRRLSRACTVSTQPN